MKKGFVHLIPLFVLALALGVSSVGIAGAVRSNSIGATSSVLASKSENASEKSANMASENSGKDKKNSDSQPGENSSSNGKKDEVPAQGKNNQNIGGLGRGSQKIEPQRIEAEVELDEQEDTTLTEATESVKPGRKVRSNFPITVNPETNEKTVTTPGGTKTIILPEVAILNMIKAGFPVVLSDEDESEEGTDSATPEGTPSGATESGEIQVDGEAEIQLTELDGELVYEIPAVKDEQFLGVVDVKIKVKGIVSAEDGEIIKIQKAIFDSILDFLSF